MEELKEIVRKIRNGESVEGYSQFWSEGMKDCILVTPKGNFKVYGTDRLRLVEMPAETETPAGTTKPPKVQREPRPVREKTPKVYLTERTCECGKVYPLTKFNQNVLKCPDCRKSRRRSTESVDRTFVCPDCGEEFIVSKFQPYYEPERCQKCNKKKHTHGR